MSTIRTARLSHTLAGFLVAASIAAPAASALPADAASPGPHPAVSSDLRSPDARDAARGVVPSAVHGPASNDLRSPDTRDAAQGVLPGDAVPVSVGVSDDGFEWSTTGISAALLAGLAIVGVGVQSAVRRTRRRVLA